LLYSQSLKDSIVFVPATGFWIDGQKEKSAMHSSASLPQTTRWLEESGAQELKSQFRAILFHPSASMLSADPEQGGKKLEAGCDLNPSGVPIAVLHGN
jgi:hypothetical protein